MSTQGSWSAAATRFLNRFHARMAARARPATAFVSQPEPRSTGSYSRGRQLCAGNLMFAGHLVEAPGAMIWDIDPPDAAWEEEIHGFRWLDDLAAVGDARARLVAQDWLWGWIERYGNGRGDGWTPEAVGRRLIRAIHHALFVLRGIDPDRSARFYRSLAAQTIFLSRRWHSAAPGLPRFEALTGLLYAGLSFEGMDAHVEPAREALGAECARQVDAQGGIPTRNPEELLEVFTLLTWAQSALEDADRTPDEEHLAAIARIAPTLRRLRHADGGLARFQGGGRGLEGRLETALAASGVRARHAEGLAMGYARLSGGRTSLIVDAAPPPGGRGLGRRACLDACLRTDLGPAPAGGELRLGRGLRRGLASRRAGDAVAFHALPRRLFQRATVRAAPGGWRRARIARGCPRKRSGRDHPCRDRPAVRRRA
ncbi:Heparinase II/III [Salipiger profundus]|uniref:Heparinase II/III n=1 Tax=Salipiger profundus TaxID=1229727 RepID=A0A1U7D030_9RHOB|nr:Heparinase II/III [Salipiger profundus]